MFYLIGVKHEAQRRKPNVNPTADQEKLKKCLIAAIEEYHPVLIAVEESEESLKDCGNCISIPQEIAECSGIAPLLCDPTQTERSTLGYKDAGTIKKGLSTSLLVSDCIKNKYQQIHCEAADAAASAIEAKLFFPLRETFWLCNILDKLNGYLQGNVVFVCGEIHICSFSKLLEDRNIQAQTIYRRIGVTDNDVEGIEKASKFPLEHPELFAELVKEFEKLYCHQTGSNPT